jgi:2-keto-4-pentenoate hydratase
MHAGFVYAGTESLSSGLAKSAQSLSVKINEVEVGSVADALSLSFPSASLRWLVGRLEQFGLQLFKGQVILTGSPMKLFPVAPGDRIVVDAPPLGASWVQIDP